MSQSSAADQIIESISIVDEVSKHVQLKPHNQEMLGLCPFHVEDTPSFYVNPLKRLYYCFGCQSGGNIITFRAKISGLTNRDALEALANDHNITLANKTAPSTTSYKKMMEHVAKYYHTQLLKTPKATQYIATRNLNIEHAKLFMIGYAPEAWQNLSQSIPYFEESKAEKIGLKVKGKKGTYDRFRNRIMFPIRSHYGEIVGFGGRSLGDEKPKYINSSDSEVFHKGEILYGLFEAVQKKESSLVVVEGYMDVISLSNAGIHGAVAALGTAFTPKHFSLAARYAENIYFCFDGDVAGQKAAYKSFNAILPDIRDQVSCFFLQMPSGEDPDSYIVKNGAEAFKKLLAEATPLSNYLLHTIPKDIDQNSLEGQAKRAQLVSGYLDKMPDSILKRLIQKQIQYTAEPPNIPIQPKQTNKNASLDQKLIELIFANRELINLNKTSLESYLQLMPPLVQNALKTNWGNTQQSLASFYVENSIQPIMSPNHQESGTSAQEIADLLNHFLLESLTSKTNEYIKKSQSNDTNTDETHKILQKLLQIKHNHKKNKIKLENVPNS